MKPSSAAPLFSPNPGIKYNPLSVPGLAIPADRPFGYGPANEIEASP
jgi:hypothetical protein